MWKHSRADAIYIHIPFCARKCEYCDFLSFNADKYQIDKYIEHLINEIKSYGHNTYDTVYIGGGTPSFIETRHIKAIIESLNITKNPEITIEVNPNSAILEKLYQYRSIGINRLSIGIQSFDDNMLKVLGRLHNAHEATATYANAQKAGFSNISLDLMFALPDESLSQLRNDLDILMGLSPNHFSIYSLIWEEGTPFYDKKAKGVLREADNDLEAAMYEMIIDVAKHNGYHHYEISNFAKDGYQSRHNTKYWQNKPYVGVGLGASGYLGNVRYKNTSSLDEYYAGNIVAEIEEITQDDFEQYEAILALRLLEEGYIPHTEIYIAICHRLEKQGYLVNKNNRYVLSKKGLFVANDVLEEFI